MTGPDSEHLSSGNLGIIKETYSKDELREYIVLSRHCRYNRGDPCGAKAIREELAVLDIHPLPSLSFIGRVLQEEGLTYRRTGNYNEASPIIKSSPAVNGGPDFITNPKGAG